MRDYLTENGFKDFDADEFGKIMRVKTNLYYDLIDLELYLYNDNIPV